MIQNHFTMNGQTTKPMDELEIKAEKITTEMMQGLANLLGEVDCVLFEKVRHQVIHLGVSMAMGVGFNAGVRSMQKIASKQVIQYTLAGQAIKSWESITDAMSATGANKSNIIRVAKGLRATAGGFKWKYSEYEV